MLAKVTRDRIMTELDADYPAYDFKTHKGYITDVHAAALTEHGPCRSTGCGSSTSGGPRASSRCPRCE